MLAIFNGAQICAFERPFECGLRLQPHLKDVRIFKHLKVQDIEERAFALFFTDHGQEQRLERANLDLG